MWDIHHGTNPPVDMACGRAEGLVNNPARQAQIELVVYTAVILWLVGYCAYLWP